MAGESSALESRTYPGELLELMSSARQRVDQGEGDVSVAREYFFLVRLNSGLSLNPDSTSFLVFDTVSLT